MKGLISQFTASVMASPFGCLTTSFRLPGSTPIIIGYTIAQISTATTRLTLASSAAAIAWTSDGATLPITIPATIARAIQTER